MFIQIVSAFIFGGILQQSTRTSSSRAISTCRRSATNGRPTWLNADTRLPATVQLPTLMDVRRSVSANGNADSSSCNESRIETAYKKTYEKYQSIPPSPIDLETTVIILDHINDSKRYYGALQDFSQQLLLSCIVLAKNPAKGGDRIKYAIVIIQSSDNNDKFLTLLKSENVDVNKAGKPCKERCSSTLLATRQYGAFEADNVFKVVDCSTADALEMIRNKYHAADVSKVIQEFCSGKR